jgi:polysaccharide biosynthesis protein PslA
MNIHQSYTLTSQLGTRRSLRWWGSLTRAAFLSAIMLVDVTAIVIMALLTGIAYHLMVYGHEGEAVVFLQVGVLSAIIFGIANLFRGEYTLANFYNFRPHVRRSIQLWNVTFVCLLALAFMSQMTVIYSRGWIVVFYVSTICVLLTLRYLSVQAAVRGSQAGLISAQRIFLVGTGEHIDQFIARYQPRRLGVNVVGYHFLTPLDASAPPLARRQALAQDVDDAILSARSLEPEAIFLVMPWSSTETINRCAESFLRLRRRFISDRKKSSTGSRTSSSPSSAPWRPCSSRACRCRGSNAWRNAPSISSLPQSGLPCWCRSSSSSRP